MFEAKSLLQSGRIPSITFAFIMRKCFLCLKCIFKIFSLFAFLLGFRDLPVSVVNGAHSRRRVTRAVSEPRYDRSITTFDPSGRMLQAEYGMEASNRGESVAAVLTKQGVVVAVRNSSQQKVHRIDDHIWLVSSGLSGDSFALASMLRLECQQHKISFGEPATVEEIARKAADTQHLLTRTGGARPLGCTAIIVGIDPQESPALFRSDPGGILEDCLYCASGKDNDQLLSSLANLYDDQIKTTARPDDDTIVKTVSKLVATMAAATDDEDNGVPVDVWIMQPSLGRRGEMRATCLLNLRNNEDSLAKIPSRLKEYH